MKTNNQGYITGMNWKRPTLKDVIPKKSPFMYVRVTEIDSVLQSHFIKYYDEIPYQYKLDHVSTINDMKNNEQTFYGVLYKGKFVGTFSIERRAGLCMILYVTSDENKKRSLIKYILDAIVKLSLELSPSLNTIQIKTKLIPENVKTEIKAILPVSQVTTTSETISFSTFVSNNRVENNSYSKMRIINKW